MDIALSGLTANLLPYLIIGAVFLIGALIFWYAHVAPEKPEPAARNGAAPAAVPAPAASPGRPVWPLRLDESATDLTVATRFALIERLGTIGAPWCAEILAQAFREEREPELRDAVLAALIESAQQASRPVFEAAFGSTRPSERAYAADGLTAIGAFDFAARGLDDHEDGVALAAAYALKRSGQSALVDRYLERHNGEGRAAEIRRLLHALE